jgi:MoaA/NifB/PqqE/SkfB family radical SAM enzyme
MSWNKHRIQRKYMGWNKHRIKIQLDTTTHCNAKCPMCHRTDPNGLDRVDWLPLTQWTLDDFKKAFNPDDLKLIAHFSFAPTWGDAMMSNHTKGMIEYIFKHNSRCSVSIDTNGSIRDEDWWWEFGLISKGGKYNLLVKFDVDGSTQEMHEKYRQGTDLQKVLNNMRAFAETKSKAYVQTIVFKHNQLYLSDIEKLIKEYGASQHIHVYSDRFDRGIDTFDFTDTNGNIQTLEKADLPVNNENYKNEVVKINENIKCSWGELNQISISFDGQVHPCCYFSNSYDEGNVRFMNTPLIKEYIEDNKNLNIFNNSLSNIINHEWFKSKLADSWESETPVPQCVSHCSSRIKMPDYFREYIPITPV